MGGSRDHHHLRGHHPLMAGVRAVQPASHIETVDPTTIGEHPEFAAPAVTSRPDGTVVVSVVAAMFSFSPDPIGCRRTAR